MIAVRCHGFHDRQVSEAVGLLFCFPAGNSTVVHQARDAALAELLHRMAREQVLRFPGTARQGMSLSRDDVPIDDAVGWQNVQTRTWRWT